MQEAGEEKDERRKETDRGWCSCDAEADRESGRKTVWVGGETGQNDLLLLWSPSQEDTCLCPNLLSWPQRIMEQRFLRQRPADLVMRLSGQEQNLQTNNRNAAQRGRREVWGLSEDRREEKSARVYRDWNKVWQGRRGGGRSRWRGESWRKGRKAVGCQGRIHPETRSWWEESRCWRGWSVRVTMTPYEPSSATRQQIGVHPTLPPPNRYTSSKTV